MAEGEICESRRRAAVALRTPSRQHEPLGHSSESDGDSRCSRRSGEHEASREWHTRPVDCPRAMQGRYADQGICKLGKKLAVVGDDDFIDTVWCCAT